MMPGGMGAMMLIGLLLLLALIGVAVYVAVRAAQRPHERVTPARDVLRDRLASGDITPEEYYERDSVLRDGEASGRRR